MRAELTTFLLPTDREIPWRIEEVKCNAQGHVPICSATQSGRPVRMSLDNACVIFLSCSSLSDIAIHFPITSIEITNPKGYFYSSFLFKEFFTTSTAFLKVGNISQLLRRPRQEDRLSPEAQACLGNIVRHHPTPIKL